MENAVRYVTKSAFVGYDKSYGISMTADEIIIEDDEPEFTGIINANGEKIYRHRERLPFGFVKE